MNYCCNVHKSYLKLENNFGRSNFVSIFFFQCLLVKILNNEMILKSVLLTTTKYTHKKLKCWRKWVFLQINYPYTDKKNLPNGMRPWVKFKFWIEGKIELVTISSLIFFFHKINLYCRLKNFVFSVLYVCYLTSF